MKANKDMLNCDNTRIYNVTENVRLILQTEGGTLLCAQANAYITDCRVREGQVCAEGMLRGSVTLENGNFNSVSAQQEFSSSVSLEGKVTANAVANVTACNMTRENGATVLEVEITVTYFCVLDASQSAVTSAESVETQISELNSSRLVGIFSTRSTLNESIELNVRMPLVDQCLQASSSAVVDRVLIKDGSVMITGDIILGVIYSCGDEYEPVTQVADRLPFSAVIDAPGAEDDDLALVTVSISEGTVRAQDNQQGERRVILCELELNIQAYVVRNQRVKMITDAYSTEYMLECTQKHITFDSVSECRKQQSVRVTVEKPDTMPPIARVCSVNAFPKVMEAVTYNGGVTLKCRGCFHVVYIVSGTGEIAGFNTSSDFELNMDCPCNESTSLQVMLATELLQAALLSGSKCEVRMVLNAHMILIDRCDQVVVEEMAQGDQRPSMSGICIYMAQNGDTLFTVGKQLGVTAEDILELNPELDNSDLHQGTRITVFRK